MLTVQVPYTGMLPRRKSKGGDCAAKRRRSKESKEPELPRPPSPDADDNEEPLFFIDTGANRDDADNGVAHDDDGESMQRNARGRYWKSTSNWWLGSRMMIY